MRALRDETKGREGQPVGATLAAAIFPLSFTSHAYTASFLVPACNEETPEPQLVRVYPRKVPFSRIMVGVFLRRSLHTFDRCFFGISRPTIFRWNKAFSGIMGSWVGHY